MEIKSTLRQLLKYIILNVLLKIMAGFLVLALLSEWMIKNIHPTLPTVLLILLVPAMMIHTAFAVRKYQFLIFIDDEGLRVSHQHDKTVDKFYKHQDYVFSINTYRMRSNMITVQHDITLNIYGRNHEEEIHYDLKFLSDKQVNEFNTLASRYQQRYDKEETKSANKEQSLNYKEVITDKSKLKDSIWAALLMFIITLAAISQFLLGNASWIWALLLSVLTASIIYDAHIKKPKEALSKIQITSDDRLIMEKNGETREFFLDEINSIEISTPGTRQGYRRIILKTSRGEEHYHYGLLAKEDQEEDYQRIIDLLFAFADDKVAYID